MSDNIFGLELRSVLGFFPSVENILHDRRQTHQRRRAFLTESFGTLIAGQIAPGADVKLIERIGAALTFFFDSFVAGNLAHVPAPFAPIPAQEAEGRGPRGGYSGHVGNALRHHATKP